MKKLITAAFSLFLLNPCVSHSMNKPEESDLSREDYIKQNHLIISDSEEINKGKKFIGGDRKTEVAFYQRTSDHSFMTRLKNLLFGQGDDNK